MPLFWLCYHYNNHISVVTKPAPSLIHARMRAALAGLGRVGHQVRGINERPHDI
jgi:hypothetical protein